MTERVDCAALAAIYANGAETYDALWSPVILPPAVQLVEAMQLGDASRVLDVGAGTGGLTDALRTAAPRATIVSLDPSPEMLQVARARRGASAVVADAMALPCASERVDAVLLAYMLFHLLDPRVGVAEAARAVRRGGQVGTVTFAVEHRPRAAQVWDEALTELDVAALPAHGNHAGLDSPDAIRELLGHAELTPTRLWTVDIEHAFTATTYWQLRADGGSYAARMAGLDRERIGRVEQELRRRLEPLTASDYVFSGTVVCSISEKRREEA